MWGYGWGEGAYRKQRHICKLPFSTFRSLQAIFPVWMCVCVWCISVCVWAHVCRYGCVRASTFSGEGTWGGGFCNVFYRKRTQMTFNQPCLWGNSRVLFCHCSFERLVEFQLVLERQSWEGRSCKCVLAEEREDFGDQQWDSATVHC